MTDFPTTARVVIIGGGAVGCSALYHLARAGWSDCVLLERNELTAGSTWHAAGNIPNFSGNWAVMNMQRYSTELYRGLAQTVDYPMNYHVTGSVRLAHSKARMQEFERARAMARHQGLDMEMMSLDDLKSRYPFMETHDLEGGLYDALDGDMDPAQLTQAYAKGARDLGAKIQRFCPATGVRRESGEWVVVTDKGDIRCEYVVNAAGYYAQRVGEWFRPHGGRRVPMMVMSHQYMLTDEIAQIEAFSAETGAKLPILRDVDSSYYLRQEKHGLNLGPYERNGKGHWMTPDDPMPEDFSFQLYPDDLDRLEWYIEDAMARVPLLGQTGINKVINGPIPYTPDGNPLIGPMPGVPNAFEAACFTFGIAQSGGAGKVLAEWIVEGGTEWDMWAVDPRRFTDHADQSYADVKGLEVYGHEYAMHFPRHEWPAGRDAKLSPLHERLLSDGAVMGPYNGWERANWFAQAGDDTSEAATETWDRHGPWERRIADEVEAVTTGCGVLDLPGFSRFELSGAGAADWLLTRIASGLPGVGRIGLAYFPDDRGRILTEMSLMRTGEDAFTLITAAPAQWHDFEVLDRELPEALDLIDRTADITTLIVCGPRSRDLLTPLTDGDLSAKWLTHQQANIYGKPVRLARVCFAGELGWEVHCAMDDAAGIYNAIRAAGAEPFGMYALNSMRIEKGYRAWKGDLTTDYTLLEAGLHRFVKLDKPQDFPGKAAMLAETPARRFATLEIDVQDYDAPAMSSILLGEEIVGEVTSGGYGYRVGAALGLAMIRADIAGGTALTVDIFGTRYPATVRPNGPAFDPANERLRA